MSISAKRQLDLCRFEKKIGYYFKDRLLIDKALTHKSYADEKNWNHISCNERLELLGDAVLDLVVVEYLYDKYPNHNEGQITKLKGLLVCGPTLTRLAERMDLKDYILVGKDLKNTEIGQRRQKNILADAFEALIGSIYTDGGWEEAKIFIEKSVIEELTEVTTGNYFNYKSSLQEISQREFKSLPEYKVLKEEGPEHHKNFNIAVAIDGKIIGYGKGVNKKEAEQKAAQNALEKLQDKLFWKTIKASVSKIFHFKWKNKKQIKNIKSS